MGIHKDSKSGESARVPVVRDPNAQGAIDLDKEADAILNEADLNQVIDDAYDQLPAIKEGKPNPETVNWLGSSYSGVDIKVIAHLYMPTDGPVDRIARLKLEQATAQRISEACDTMLTGFANFAAGIDPDALWAERRSQVLKAAGLDEAGDEAEQRAISFMLSIFAEANFRSVIGIAKMRRRLENTYEAQKSLADSLKTDIEDLEYLATQGKQTVVLATLQTISVQSHREKFAVRALGHSYVKGYTRGQRTIAGSMIFTVFNEHALAQLQRAMGQRKEFVNRNEISTLLPDQLPPIDLTIVFANEYGHLSEMRLYGVEFVNDGVTFSIEDLLSENVMQFVARDADVLTDRGKVRLSRMQRGTFDFENDDDSGSKLLDDENYLEYLDKIGVRRRLKNR